MSEFSPRTQVLKVLTIVVPYHNQPRQENTLSHPALCGVIENNIMANNLIK